MFTPEVIPAGRAELRPPGEQDADAIARACTDPMITRFIPSVPVPYTRDDAVAYLSTASEEWRRGGAFFTIADPASGDWLGNIGLKRPDPHGNREIGYLVAPWARGRGLATAATRALTEWAFARDVRRVELLADLQNLASQRVAGAAGFQREGVRRASERRRDGRYYDMVAFSRLSDDPGLPVRPFLPYPADDEITDGVVRLTPIAPHDAADFHAMMSDPEVLKYHVPPQSPPPEEIAARCRMTITWWLSGQRAELAVRDAVTDEFAGHIQLMDVVPVIGQAMLGYSLVAPHRGKGLATRAVNLLVSWAFGKTGLRRIVAGTNPDNRASQAVLQRAGFTPEALIRGLLPGPGGTRQDDLQWALLRR
ncbi:GNAT family N-acetyltransferase [Spongiactinospora sp. TRM90649]|uniref:GNAT family N-acetyltransferase n=1 Tax=Spongiactinospora sp. TRM90649 TaxID=3031114 RepID=UPI0023F9A44C|nr:GNAT family N-acetyltransferase [Spongiactinospora sp. TRM90649]MDF5753815.1 GNAT family N-acetyltransferase [Spongiactinospora sp. TRM90649]